jgi:hypothetical protein
VTEAQAKEVINQAESLRQQEELRLLTLQNEHYKQTLDGQRLLVQELYKALK